MKLSDYVFEALADHGVGHVFMLPGGGCMHLVDSLGNNPRLRFVTVLHEQAAAIAADAYAQATTGLGACLVTTGPGGSNAITGVLAAWNDSTPVVVISGQVKRSDLMAGSGVRMLGPQEADIVALVRPITKVAVTVTDPASIRFHVEQALWLATHGRPGPVWLDIPLDVQAAQIEPATLRAFEPPAEPPPPNLDAIADLVLDRLAAAKRPALFLGNGVRLAHAEASTLRLAERLGVPVLLTWKALDLLPEDHPQNAGRPGSVASRYANFTQQNADWLLIIGNRLDRLQTAFNPAWFARGAHKIVVDVDEAEIRKQGWTDCTPIVADAGVVVEALHRALDRRAGPAWTDPAGWRAQVADWKVRYPLLLPEYAEEEGINLYALVHAIAAQLGPDDLYVPGSSGACSEISMQAFPSQPGLRVLNTEGLGPMGFGPPAALGACIALGGKRTVCLDGDGGFPMNMQELETIRRLNLPIKILVLDNGGYGSIVATQSRYFDGRLYGSVPEFGLTLPDPCKVAAAFGIPSDTLTSHATLDADLKRILATPGPVVVRVKVSAKQATQPRTSSRALPDGRMVTAPMEDMFPFLSREELAAQMSVPLIEDPA